MLVQLPIERVGQPLHGDERATAEPLADLADMEQPHDTWVLNAAQNLRLATQSPRSDAAPNPAPPPPSGGPPLTPPPPARCFRPPRCTPRPPPPSRSAPRRDTARSGVRPRPGHRRSAQPARSPPWPSPVAV